VGAWNSVRVAAADVKGGTTYWLVVLGRGPTYFRRRVGACATQTSFAKRMSSLPATWTGGVRSTMCPISAYVTGRVSTVHGPLVPAAPNPVGTSGTVPVTSGNGGSDGTGTSTITTTTSLPPTVPPVNAGPPAITGTAQQGQTLATSTASWLDDPTSYAYQWQDCGGSGNGCGNIAGPTSSSYALQSSDVGQTVRVVVTATNAGGSSSAASGVTGFRAGIPTKRVVVDVEPGVMRRAGAAVRRVAVDPVVMVGVVGGVPVSVVVEIVAVEVDRADAAPGEPRRRRERLIGVVDVFPWIESLAFPLRVSVLPCKLTI
jgi:hypothetical protein